MFFYAQFNDVNVKNKFNKRMLKLIGCLSILSTHR